MKRGAEIVNVQARRAAACRRLHGGVTVRSLITRSAWSADFSASSSSRTAWSGSRYDDERGLSAACRWWMWWVDVMGGGDAAAVTGGAHLANLAHVVGLKVAREETYGARQVSVFPWRRRWRRRRGRRRRRRR